MQGKKNNKQIQSSQTTTIKKKKKTDEESKINPTITMQVFGKRKQIALAHYPNSFKQKHPHKKKKRKKRREKKKAPLYIITQLVIYQKKKTQLVEKKDKATAIPPKYINPTIARCHFPRPQFTKNIFLKIMQYPNSFKQIYLTPASATFKLSP